MEQIISLIQENLVLALTLVPIVTGIVEAIKRAGFPSNWCGVLAMPVGALLSVGLFSFSGGVAYEVAITLGVIVGLASSGLWSTSKAVMRPSEVADFGGEA